MVCWRGGVRWGKREAERGGGRNTIKREQRVKGTDLVMGEKRRGEGAVLSARAPHNERLNFLWPGWHTKSAHPGSAERERAGERGERERTAG